MSWSRNKSVLVRRVLAGSAIAAALGSVGTAHAATLRADGAVHLVAQRCAGGTAARLAPEAAPQPAAAVAAPYSKSAAILGGQPSALDLIRQTQELGDLMPASGSLAATEPAPIPPLAPAIGGARVRRAGCLAPAIAAPARLPGSDDILASKRLAIGQTPYDSDWQRVSGDRISARRVRRLIGDTSDRRATLQSVNSWVNRSIAFTDDRELFQRADFWAGAATTLRLRRGDCEDIAITKQLVDAGRITVRRFR